VKIHLEKISGGGGPTPLDAYLTINLIKNLNEPLTILEVGVFTGGFVICHLRNNEDLTMIGVDPYPGLEDFRQKLFENLDNFEVRDRYVHYDNLNEIKSDSSFSLVHIDGEHSESAVDRDLNLAANLMAEVSIIVVDDFFHLDFPGVSSAVYRFLHNSDYCSFMITHSKIYICKSIQHDEWLKKARKIMDDMDIDYEIDHEPVVSQGYQSSNAINGFKNLIVKFNPAKERNLRIALEIDKPRLMQKLLIQSFKLLAPGGIIYLMRLLKSQLRRF
jgi:hypothetical protein